MRRAPNVRRGLTAVHPLSAAVGRLEPIDRVRANDRNRLGFRLPAQRERSIRAKGAGVSVRVSAAGPA
jgi:hypothetical protein